MQFETPRCKTPRPFLSVMRTGMGLFAFYCLFVASNPPPANGAAVLTYHNDNARTGLNANETILTPANVNTNTFGLLVSHPVDDQIYAQPLVMTNVNIPARGTHNIVIAATVNDTVYAFDADDPTVSAPYWQTNLLVPNSVAPRNSDMTGACGGNYQDFHGNMGIVGTPVIDPATRTLYVLARTKENGVTFVQRLHALDVTTGTERPGSPVIVAATYPLSGGGTLTFDPMKQNPRPGLVLANGVVYLGFSSHCDWGPLACFGVQHDSQRWPRRYLAIRQSPGSRCCGQPLFRNRQWNV